MAILACLRYFPMIFVAQEEAVALSEPIRKQKPVTGFAKKRFATRPFLYTAYASAQAVFSLAGGVKNLSISWAGIGGLNR